MTFLFPFPSHSHRIISIPTHCHSHSWQRLYIDYLKPRNMYIVLWIKNKIWSYSRSVVNQTQHSSVIIIITITVYHCSLFNVYQTVTACYCAKAAGCSHCRWTTMEFFSRIKYAIPIPINSPKLVPILMGMGSPIPMHTSNPELSVWAN